GRRAREGGAAGALDWANPGRAEEWTEPRGGEGGAPLEEGEYILPPAFVCHPPHRHFRDRGMQRQAAFDLHRRDVLAAADDHVVDAAGDEEIAVAVEISGVAGEIPALAQRLGIRVRPPPIALEGFIARHQRDDLAF